ncbi:MAG: hypothetical protein ABSG00_03255 [Terracidiphilus sp.]|jgi:hypothetical protein
MSFSRPSRSIKVFGVDSNAYLAHFSHPHPYRFAHFKKFFEGNEPLFFHFPQSWCEEEKRSLWNRGVALMPKCIFQLYNRQPEAESVSTKGRILAIP